MKNWDEVYKEMQKFGTPISVLGYCKIAFDIGCKSGLEEALQIAEGREIKHCKTHKDEIINNTACCIADDILFRIEELV